MTAPAASPLRQGGIDLPARLRAVWTAAPRHAAVAVAATVAYLIAFRAAGHSHPYFAPITTVIVLGVTAGAQLRRAAQLLVGVTIGVAVAAAIVHLVGTGAWQTGVVIFTGMSAAVFVGGDQLAVRQAAGAAVLVALVAFPSDPLGFQRLEDALIGIGVAILLTVVISPIDPVGLGRSTLRDICDELAQVLEAIAAALEAVDVDAITDAAVSARALDQSVPRRMETLVACREASRLSIWQRRHRELVGSISHAAERAVRAQRDSYGLARVARRPIELGDHVPEGTAAAVRRLAESSRLVPGAIGDGSRAKAVRSQVAEAVSEITSGLEETGSLSVNMIVGQSRLIANDLLQAVGVEPLAARQAIRAAGG